MNKLRYLLLLLPIGCWAQAQTPTDTAAIIKEFSQVMSFSVQPYLHYSSIISMRASPLTDTTKADNILHNEFYKVQNDLYYGNEQEEIYLQDSLLVRISHSRKMIQLNKVDVSTKKKIDVLPLKRTDMQKMLREHCTLSQLSDEGDTGHILMKSQEKQSPQGSTSSEMIVQYKRSSHLPLLMELSMHFRQDETPQMMDMLRAQGFDVERMEQEKDGKKGLTMTQTASVSFGDIETTKEKALLMPLWTARVAYDDHTDNYTGKGRCEGYEVVKTF